MQITLFQALQGIKVPDDEAEAVVDRLETHVERVVTNKLEAVEGHFAAIEGKLVGMQASLDALRSQIQFMTVMLGVIGLAIAAGPIIAKFIR